MTDQTLDLDAIEARHAADEAREGEDTGSFFMPMDSQGWATGPAVSYNPLPPIDGERAHADRAALLAEVRKLREALAEVPDAVGAASMQFIIILSLCMRAIDMTGDDTPADLALASEIENCAPKAQKAMTDLIEMAGKIKALKAPQS